MYLEAHFVRIDYTCTKVTPYDNKYKWIYISFFHSRNFFDKRISAECSAECLGEEWKVSLILWLF